MVEENCNLLKTNLFSYVLSMLLLDLFQIFGLFRRLLTLADLLFVCQGKAVYFLNCVPLSFAY